jgi:hypothetical protein
MSDCVLLTRPSFQTADVYYRKFKEPLPDPASRLLDSIEVLEERHLDEYCAVFKRRLLRFRYPIRFQLG